MVRWSKGRMERSRLKLFLLGVCLITLAIAYGIFSHKSSKKKMAPEMRTGLKALTDPESLLKD